MANETRLVGQNYETPDLVAKVTGRAKYAEDYRAEGMLFCKILLSPFPHARVKSIDASEALKLPGVEAILTADEVPVVAPPVRGLAAREEEGPEGRSSATKSNVRVELALTNEPMFYGDPILAVAAVDETTAANAIELINVEYELLPFCVDPLESLRPGGPNARLEGNVWNGTQAETFKYTPEQWQEVEAGRLPFCETPDKWEVGDVDAAFKEADLIIDETVVHQSAPHQTLETRTAMAYWQNGKLHMYMSAQSYAHIATTIGRWSGVNDPDNLVLVSEYCGGAWGGKNPELHMHTAIPALLAKKTGKPVMFRVSREEDHMIGRNRAGLHMRAKIGFRKDGRITAMDLMLVQNGGPYTRPGDYGAVAGTASVGYTPINMRFRGIAVLTNTPTPGPQRGPGGEQCNMMLEPLISKAAKQLGIDQVEIHKINAAVTGSEFGPPEKNGKRSTLTSAHGKEALEKGAALFNWEERKKRSGQRQGSKVTGVGVALGSFTAGTTGFDGLLLIRSDGKLYIQQGVGNLGTHSVFDTARVAADVLGMPWEQCVVEWGDTRRHLAWSSRQGGSQTSYATSRANHATAMDTKRKLQEIAAKKLGGNPDDYDVGGARVFHKGNPGRGLTFAQAATEAIALGGRYDGHEMPSDISPFTKKSVTALAGQGLIGVAKDNYPAKGSVHSFVAAFAEVEVDLETGTSRIVDLLQVADVGTVLNPRGLAGQMNGGAIMGIGLARSQKWVYDQHYGVPLAKRFYQTRPATILDIPEHMSASSVGIPDPSTPVGSKGIGEPSVGGAACVRCALADAIGEDLLRRTPVMLDMILSSVEAGERVDAGLVTHV